MRLYPPAWIVGREALRDLELSAVRTPGGLDGPALAVGRPPRPALVPDPEAFRPERWLDGVDRALRRYAYFPFGGGPRVCVGNHFAMLEAVLVLATLLARLDLATVPETQLELTPAVTLRPSGAVQLRVSARG